MGAVAVLWEGEEGEGRRATTTTTSTTTIVEVPGRRRGRLITILLILILILIVVAIVRNSKRRRSSTRRRGRRRRTPTPEKPQIKQGQPVPQSRDQNLPLIHRPDMGDGARSPRRHNHVPCAGSEPVIRDVQLPGPAPEEQDVAAVAAALVVEREDVCVWVVKLLGRRK